MAYLNIDPREVKFAGAGAKLQWAMAIGIGVDQFVHEMARQADDGELLDKIREQLSDPGRAAQFKDPAKLHPRQIEVVDGILHSLNTKLSIADLAAVFHERR
jgi:hypothetical protein